MNNKFIRVELMFITLFKIDFVNSLACGTHPLNPPFSCYQPHPWIQCNFWSVLVLSPSWGESLNLKAVRNSVKFIEKLQRRRKTIKTKTHLDLNIFRRNHSSCFLCAILFDNLSYSLHCFEFFFLLNVLYLLP